jgi:hypothetical protein
MRCPPNALRNLLECFMKLGIYSCAEISLLLFLGGDIHKYEVPTKYTKKFLGVLYEIGN